MNARKEIGYNLMPHGQKVEKTIRVSGIFSMRELGRLDAKKKKEIAHVSIKDRPPYLDGFTSVRFLTIHERMSKEVQGTRHSLEFLNGVRACKNGNDHTEGESLDFDRGYSHQYEKEQIRTNESG